jgi:hypothetical protein
VTWDTKQVKLELRPEVSPLPFWAQLFLIESKNCKNATPRRSAEQNWCAPVFATNLPPALGKHPQPIRTAGLTADSGGSVTLGGVRGEPVGQLTWAAEADVVAAVHLVGVDAEALAGVASRPPC